MTPAAPMYRLVSPGLLRLLMQRTGTGAPVSIRRLAALAGVPRGTVGNLLTGTTRATSAGVAERIAQVIGVDLLVLWVPVGRSVPADLAEVTPHRDAS